MPKKFVAGVKTMLPAEFRTAVPIVAPVALVIATAWVVLIAVPLSCVPVSLALTPRPCYIEQPVVLSVLTLDSPCPSTDACYCLSVYFRRKLEGVGKVRKIDCK